MNDNVQPPTLGHPYSQGLRHGREDLSAEIRRVLALDISDTSKLEQIGQWVAERPEWTDTGSGPGWDEPRPEQDR